MLTLLPYSASKKKIPEILILVVDLGTGCPIATKEGKKKSGWVCLSRTMAKRTMAASSLLFCGHLPMVPFILLYLWNVVTSLWAQENRLSAWGDIGGDKRWADSDWVSVFVALVTCVPLGRDSN